MYFAGERHVGRGPYNPRPPVQYGNAGGGRTAGAGGRGGDPSNLNALHIPDVAPAPGNLFTFARVSAVQCESDERYDLREGSEEHRYFMHWVCTALTCAHSPKMDSYMTAVEARTDETMIEFAHMEYGQLTYFQPPGHHAAEGAVPGEYTTYEMNKTTYAVNPSGKIYLVKHEKAWQWSWKAVVKVDLGDLGGFDLGPAGGYVPSQRVITYAVRFEVVKLPKDVGPAVVVPPDQKVGSMCVRLSYGELLQDGFVPWSVFIYIGDKEIMGALTNHRKWLKASAPQEEDEEEEQVGGNRAPKSAYENPVAHWKYQFSNVDDVLCVWVPPAGKKEGYWWSLTNFTVDALLAIYENHDREKGTPLWRIKCTAIVDPDGSEIMYITPESTGPRTADNVRTVTAEVLLPMATIDDRNLAGYFSKVTPYLKCQKYFKAEHITCKMMDFTPFPRITRIVEIFGRQPKDTLFVFANVCYDKGNVFAHEEQGVVLFPAQFCAKDCAVPMKVDEMPRILLVPQDWVRYAFLVNFWSVQIPRYFRNNTMQAKCAFAISLSHLHCSKFWDGQGVQNGVATPYLKSTAPNTGKTEILMAVHRFMGWSAKSLNQGSVNTLAGACYRMCELQADNTYCLDEIVTYTNAEESSKKVKELTHLAYNGSVRECIGKSESMQTTFMGTSNVLVNEKDMAFMQRILLIVFSPPEVEVEYGDETVKDEEWAACKNLLSCLQPDLEQLLWNDKLDREALQDCTTFMNKATRQVYSRNANIWGFALYYMLMMEGLTQSDTVGVDAVFEYCCQEVIKQNYMATQYSDLIAQFILAIQSIYTTASPLVSEEKCFFHHNFRTMEKPDGIAQLGTLQFYAVRIESACHVIKKVKNITFKVEEIRRALNECTYAVHGWAPFFNVGKCGYPPTKELVFDEPGAMNQTVPLPEDELLQAQLKKERCVFFQQPKWNQIVKDVETIAKVGEDYRKIEITTANRSWGPRPGHRYTYNFFETVTGRADGRWFGFRALGSTKFAPYCGWSNCIPNIRSGPEIDEGLEDLTEAEGWGSVDLCFNPKRILEHYCYTKFPDDDTLPPPLRINPFLFRNDDADVTMPNDQRSVTFYHQCYDSDPGSPSQRESNMDERSGGETSNQSTPNSRGSNRSYGRGAGAPPGSSRENTPRNLAKNFVRPDQEDEVRAKEQMLTHAPPPKRPLALFGRRCKRRRRPLGTTTASPRMTRPWKTSSCSGRARPSSRP
tara:strand:+ start:1729 stop:5412 length:3684 start_codon:yes stop_codon:yes gene_type:complete